MCTTCGCSDDNQVTFHNLVTDGRSALGSEGHQHASDPPHSHARDHRHAHSHDHDHEHEHEHVLADGTKVRHRHRAAATLGAPAALGALGWSPSVPAAATPTPTPTTHPHSLLELEVRVLAKNDELAARNRTWFAGQRVLALNLVSSPGAGKTTLLERTIRDLRDQHALYVIEGDQATSHDGERIRAAGAAAVQINTGTGCHLEADMVARALHELSPPVGAIVMIENVGNLVCPALFDLGEHTKVAILSVTEGVDKPLKYPHMFRAANLILINKIDLLPYVDFDVAAAIDNARTVNPQVAVLEVSARSGVGLAAWYQWLSDQLHTISG
jgi:hydrogenase nickel incorporation protein HypB